MDLQKKLKGVELVIMFKELLGEEPVEHDEENGMRRKVGLRKDYK